VVRRRNAVVLVAAQEGHGIILLFTLQAKDILPATHFAPRVLKPDASHMRPPTQGFYCSGGGIAVLSYPWWVNGAQANQDATLTTDNQQSGRPAVASQETQSGLTWTAAQTERTDSLAATLAPVLSHGLGERDLHAVITALKDMLTSPHAEPWSKALLSAILVRVEQS